MLYCNWGDASKVGAVLILSLLLVKDLLKYIQHYIGRMIHNSSHHNLFNALKGFQQSIKTSLFLVILQ